jgi:hypothetical protein
MTGSVVSIHPEKAVLLADALARAALELGERSRRLLGVLLAVGEDIGPAASVARAGVDLAASGRLLQQVLVEVRRWEAAGTPRVGVQVLDGDVTAAHRDPLAARTAARVAVAHWREGEWDRFVEELHRWHDDPVFAGTVLDALGPHALVEHLDTLGHAWALPADDAERVQLTLLVAGLAELLAVTTRDGAPAFTVAELRDAADDADRGPAVLGLLFARCASWDPTYLATLARAVVVPLNRAAIETGVADQAWFGPSAALTDGRVLVLGAVAASPEACRLLLAGGELGSLLDARAAYLDGGTALASVLLSGARPGAGEGSTAGWSSFAEVVSGSATVPSLPIHVLPVLGSVVAPWIGALGDLHPGASGLDPQAVDAYLRHASVDPASEAELWGATLAWVGRELGGLGPAPTTTDAARVGTTVRQIVDATHEQTRREAAALDLDEAARQARWSAILAVATSPSRVPPAAGVAASVVGSRVIDAWASSRLDEVEFLRALPAFLADGQQALEYLVVATLWGRVDRHRWFAVEHGSRMPGDSLARSLEGEPFVDGQGRLRPWPDLSLEDRAAFRAWLLDAGMTRATVHLLAVEAGGAYGRGPVAAAPTPAGGVVSSGGRIEDPATTE